MKALTPEEGYQWAAGRCSTSEQCRHDIEEKLRQRGVPSSACQCICNRLEEEGYIDEARYVRAFVHDKYEFNGWGRLKIAQALRMRGISSALIQPAMASLIDDDEYLSRLSALLTRRGGTREQQMRFAASRGFEPASIYRALESE